MKRLIGLAVLSGLVISSPAQEIFKAKWVGMGVQEFSSTSPINRFSISGPDASGYVYLKAHSSTSEGDIIQTKWKGTAVQEFSPGEVITGFETSGPDIDGYVCLIAVANDGSRGEILKTRWQGTAVQGYSAPSGEAISGFTVSGPDAAGYITLSAVTAPFGISEKFDQGKEPPLVFAFNPITPNPAWGCAQISYSIAKSSEVNLQVYDCSGRLVKRLVDDIQEPGRYNLKWLGTDDKGRKVGAGIYFVKLDAGDFRAVKKIVVIK
jgi:hypothetical protein